MIDELDEFPRPVARFRYNDLDGRSYKRTFRTVITFSTGLIEQEEHDLTRLGELELSAHIKVENI